MLSVIVYIFLVGINMNYILESVGLLTIDGDPDVEEHGMFQRCMYLSVFYCLCYLGRIGIGREVYGPEWGEGYHNRRH